MVTTETGTDKGDRDTMAKHRKRTAPRRLALALGVMLAALTLTGAPDVTTPAAEAQPQPTPARVIEPAQVTVVDNSMGTWHGVRRAVRAWDRSPLVSITVADTCVADTYCVYMDAYDHGSASWLGLTSPLDDTHAHVQLNTHGKVSKRLQTGVACHEIGHALGIAHPDGTEAPDTRGCIAAPNPANTTPVASDADRAKLLQASRGHGPQAWGAVVR